MGEKMNKNELKKIIKSDKFNYKKGLDNRKYLFFLITKNNKIRIMKYIIIVRKYSYYKERMNKTILDKCLYLFYAYKKNKLGSEIDLDIGSNNFGKNLLIFHKNIIINENAKIGDNCKLHGNNCIGNDGITKECPKIGDNVDIGIGATLIGDIHIADNIIIGANSIVTKDFLEKGIIIAGNPAKRIK